MKREGHGGKIFEAAKDLGIGESQVLDLSASINPLGIPQSALTALRRALPICVHYPDTESTHFMQAISERFGVEQACVLAGNGSTELVYLLPLALKPRSVLVTAPAFSEYERAALRAGARIKRLRLRESEDFRIEPHRFAQAMRGTDMAFLCNPNNPTGHALTRDEVLYIVLAARKEKCVLVLDEAFVDFIPSCSAIDVNNPYLVVLRSMTKFYAIAGLRLGYGVFPKAIAKKLKRAKEPWTVNTLAQRAGTAALLDASYTARTFKLMRREKTRMEAGLWQMGLRPLHSDANFYLLHIKGDSSVAQTLLHEDRILVRRCDNFRGLGSDFIRVAVRSREENVRFLEALKKHV